MRAWSCGSSCAGRACRAQTDRSDPALMGLVSCSGLELKTLLQGARLQLLARLQLQHGPPIAHPVHVHHAAGKHSL